MTAWLLSLPWWSLAFLPVLASLVVGFALMSAARAELLIRAGHHRGVYQFGHLAA